MKTPHRHAFANSFEFCPEKPLVIPYGQYMHAESGIMQTIDRDSALAFANAVAEARRVGAPGLPVYVGHPDVPDLAPRYPDKGARGWVHAIEIANEQCALQVKWNDAPKPGAFIYFSPYLMGESTSPTEAHIDDLLSIGLTNRPNSTRFRLPNEAPDASNPNTSPERDPPMTPIATLLGLAEDASPEDIAAALQAVLDEKAALAAQVDDLTRKGEETTAEVAAANEALEEEKKALANERTARIGLLLDCAMSEGRVTPATRPVWEGRLRKDFANEAQALGRAPSTLKTRTVLANQAPDDRTAAGILARYEAMPAGDEKDTFLRKHAQQINAARNAAG